MTAHALDPYAPVRRWVAWQLQTNGDGKTKKPPFYLNGAGKPEYADPTDAKTWMTQAQAEALARQLGNKAGIGLVLGDLGTGAFICGIDLDTCIDKDGKLAPWAEQILAESVTYAEVSPSTTGIKVFFACKSENVRPFLDLIGVAPGCWGMKRSIGGNGGREHGPAVEVYCRDRYFVATKDGWPSQPDQVAVLDWPALEAIAQTIRGVLGAQVGGGGESPERVRDESRSARALGIAGELYRAGRDWDEIFEALAAHPETAEWYREKGVDRGRHELRNIIITVVEHDVAVARLARLSGEEYVRTRSAVAVEIDVGQVLLDRLVAQKRLRQQERAGAAQTSDWPMPAPLLSDELDAAPQFCAGFLPEALSDFASDSAERMQCPVDIIAIPLIIGAATVIGRRWRLAPKSLDDWTERACLWGGVILPSGQMKTPAMQRALRPIRLLEAEFSTQHQKEMEAYRREQERAQYHERCWQEECKQASKDGKEMPEKPKEAEQRPPPRLRRLTTSDVTQEMLVDLIDQNPRGLALFRDELSGWFAGFNQYRPGADRQFYLECHSGGAYPKDRRVGSTMVEDLYLNICGGFQPDVVRSVLDGGDCDGMTARFSLLVWPNRFENFEYVDRQPNLEAEQEVESVFKRLVQLDPKNLFGAERPGVIRALRFDHEAQPIFVKWYTENQRRIRKDKEADAFTSHLSKYAGLFARLGIVHHLIRCVLGEAQSPTLVDVTTATAVWTFIDEYLEPHARRKYRHLGADPARAGARRIAQWLRDNPGVGQFTARDIKQKDWSGLTRFRRFDLAFDNFRRASD